MVQDSRKLPPQPQLKVSPQRKEQTGIEEENWANITDPRKRRQIQNRLSQRNYRSHSIFLSYLLFLDKKLIWVSIHRIQSEKAGRGSGKIGSC